jgi:hypothetical protein
MSKIYQGSTAINKLRLPFTTQSLEKFKIMYKQNGNIVLTKRNGEVGVTAADDLVTVALTQEETFYFDSEVEVEVQVRVKTLDGDVATSEPIVTTVGECFDREVL